MQGNLTHYSISLIDLEEKILKKNWFKLFIIKTPCV